MSSDYFQALVIDQGSGLIKAGIAGDEKPKLVFPNYVGTHKYDRAMPGGEAEGEYFVGEKASSIRGILRLHRPMRHGTVVDWENMQRVWQHTYSELRVRHEEHPVLLTEPPLNPRSNREKTAEIFFETFSSPALQFQMEAILSLYASGRTTGVVLDSGDGTTYAVPVFEGFPLQHAIRRIYVAGRDVTNYLQVLLRKAGYNFHTSSEMETVQAMKEEICRVLWLSEASQLGKRQLQDTEEEVSFKLPDGNTIQIKNDLVSKAPELLFDPSLVGLEYDGIPKCLVDSIQMSDLDLRRKLYGDILLAGGSTLFDGFGDRMLREVKALAPRDTKIRIYASKERINAPWLGGSILASLASFKKVLITRQEYIDAGDSKSVLLRKGMY